MKDFGPEPFGGIYPSFIFGEVNSSPTPGGSINFFRLLDGGMVLPEDEHGVGIIFEFVFHGQRCSLPVYRTESRTGGIDPDPYHFLTGSGGKFGQRSFNGGFQSLDI